MIHRLLHRLFNYEVHWQVWMDKGPSEFTESGSCLWVDGRPTREHAEYMMAMCLRDRPRDKFHIRREIRIWKDYR